MRGAMSWLQSLQCGQSPLTALPALVYAVCVAALLQRLLAASRRGSLRNVSNVIKTLVFVWLMRQAIKIWVLLLSLMDSLLRLYWHKMGLWFPSKRFLMYSQEEPDISWLPLFVQLILQPYLMKIILCSLLAFLPLLLLCCVRRRPPLREFVIWFDPHPPNRTELGEAAYFLERPYLPLRDHHDHLARASTGCIPQSSSPPSLRSTKSAQ